jgi:hypothetical protein
MACRKRNDGKRAEARRQPNPLASHCGKRVYQRTYSTASTQTPERIIPVAASCAAEGLSRRTIHE